MTDQLLDFTKKREEKIEQKRRTFERVLFQNLLGAYSVIDSDDGTIFPIELVDISREGCLFQVPWNVKKNRKMSKGHETTIRMYFTKESFIPVIVKIKYGKEIEDNGQIYMQYGCEFDDSMPSFEAIGSFIDFMYKFAEHSTVDHGESKVFFI